MKLFRATLTICEACIAGEGQECHTPGCTMYLHRVDLPIEVDDKVELGDVDDSDKLSREIRVVAELNYETYLPVYP